MIRASLKCLLALYLLPPALSADVATIAVSIQDENVLRQIAAYYENIENVQIVVQERQALDLDFTSAPPLMYVCSSQSLSQISKRSGPKRELGRFIKRGGLVVVTLPDQHAPKGFDLAQLFDDQDEPPVRFRTHLLRERGEEVLIGKLYGGVVIVVVGEKGLRSNALWAHLYERLSEDSLLFPKEQKRSDKLDAMP